MEEGKREKNRNGGKEGKSRELEESRYLRRRENEIQEGREKRK